MQITDNCRQYSKNNHCDWMIKGNDDDNDDDQSVDKRNSFINVKIEAAGWR